MKKESRNLLLIIILFAGYVVLEYLAPEPVNWNPSYSLQDKIPYGGYVFRKMLDDYVPGKSIFENSLPFSESLPRYIEQGTFSLLVLDQQFDPDPWDIHFMMDAARKGNTIFISSFQIGKALSDSLDIKTFFNPFDSILFTADSSRLRLLNPSLRKENDYSFQHRILPSYLQIPDSIPYLALGTDESLRLNFIAIPVDKGIVYIHLQPVVFTNYHLLYDKPDYTAAVLSYIPPGPVVWDEFYKPGRGESGSPLRFVLHQKALKTALYLVLIAVLLLMVFHSRRIRKMIPLIHPQRNTSMDYARVLGQLYFNQGDHKDLVLKKIRHFTEYCRRKYYLGSGLPDEDWVRRLAMKSGYAEEKILSIFRSEREILVSGSCSETLLVEINHEIESFYKDELITLNQNIHD